MTTNLKAKGKVILLILCLVMASLVGIAGLDLAVDTPIAQGLSSSESGGYDTNIAPMADGDPTITYRDSFGQPINFNGITPPESFSGLSFNLKILEGEYILPDNTKFISWRYYRATTPNVVRAERFTTSIDEEINISIHSRQSLIIELNIELDQELSVVANSPATRVYDKTASAINAVVTGEDTALYNYEYSWTKDNVDLTIDTKSVDTRNVADSGRYTFKIKATLNANPNYTQEYVYKDVASVTITPKPITVTASAGITKVYDGGIIVPTINPAELSIVGKIDGDDVAVASVIKAEFTSKNVLGANNSVISITTTLSGADHANYIVSTSDIRGTITATGVSLDGTRATSREYDGSTNVELSGTTINGLIGNDVVTITNGRIGSINNKNVGNSLAVTTNMGLSGADAANYYITEQPTDVTVNITAKHIGLANLIAKARVYNGLDTVELEYTGFGAGVVAGDDVTVKSIIGTMNTRNAGLNAVIATVELDGADASNYVYDSALNNDVNARINKRELLISGITIDSKVYDSTRAMIARGGSITNLISGDDLAFSIDSALANDANAGVNKNVICRITLSGNDKDNYFYAGNPITGVIVPMDVKASVSDNVVVYNGTVQKPTITIIGDHLEDSVDKIGIAHGSSYKNASSTPYRIAITSTNNNYRLVDAAGEALVADFTINQLEVTFDWNVPELMIEGVQHTVKAAVTNAQASDVVTLLIENNSNRDAGQYTAKIIGVSNDNYKLPSTDLEREYDIKKGSLTNTNSMPNQPDIIFSSSAGFNYGSLLEARAQEQAGMDYSALFESDTQGIKISYRIKLITSGVEEDVNYTVKVYLVAKAEWRAASEFAIMYGNSTGAHKATATYNEDTNMYEFEATDGIHELIIADFVPKAPTIFDDPKTMYWLITLLVVLLLGAVAAVVWYIIVRKRPHNIYFDSNGGSACERITAKCGDTIILPTPEKDELTFGGWYKSASYKKLINYNKMPFWEETLIGKWIDASGVTQNYVNSKGKEVVATKLKDTETDSNTIAIIFNTRGGQVIEPIRGKADTVVALPSPIKPNDAFIAWYYDIQFKKKAAIMTMPSDNTTLFAKWASDDNSPTGSPNRGDAAKKVDSGEITSRPVTNIIGSNNNVPKSATERAADDFIASRFAQANAPKVEEKIKITFNVRGGSAVDNIEAAAHESITLPNPTKEGSTFMGWFNDNNLTKEVYLVKMPTKNVVLFAKWAEDATVQEMYDKGIVNDDEINKGKEHVNTEQRKIDELITKAENGTVVERSVATKTVIGVASAAKAGKLRSIEFDCRGGEPLSPIEAREGEAITLPNAVKPGARFLGWFYDKKCSDMAIMTTAPSKNTRLYAKWDR